jgi:hypothetical protein
MELITLDKDYPPYKKGLRWANPSVAHAAELMRDLYDNPEKGVKLGLIAQRDICDRFSAKAVGERMKKRLNLIEKARNKA